MSGFGLFSPKMKFWKKNAYFFKIIIIKIMKRRHGAVI